MFHVLVLRAPDGLAAFFRCEAVVDLLRGASAPQETLAGIEPAYPVFQTGTLTTSATASRLGCGGVASNSPTGKTQKSPVHDGAC